MSLTGNGPPPLTIEAVLRDHLDFIAGSLSHFGVPDQDVEDASQEVLRAVMTSLPAFDPAIGEPRPWLYGVAFRQSRIYLRRTYRQRERLLEEPAAILAIADPHLNAEEQMTERERRAQQSRAVREVLATLDLDRRAVLIGVELHGMSASEIAAALEIPIGTAKTRLRAAREELRAGLARRLPIEDRSHAILLPLATVLAMPKLSEAVRRRLREYVERLGAPGGAPPIVGPPAVPAAPMDAGPAAPRVAGLLARIGARSIPGLGPFVVGALFGGAAVFAIVSPREAPPPALAARDAAPAASAASAAAPSVTAVPPSPVHLAAAEPSAAPAAELASEPELMSRAARALDRGDKAAARASLEQHARSYPRGKMASSRDMLWVRLLLLEGNRAEAEARAEAIRKASPDSPMLKTLDTLLGTPPTP